MALSAFHKARVCNRQALTLVRTQGDAYLSKPNKTEVQRIIRREKAIERLLFFALSCNCTHTYVSVNCDFNEDMLECVHCTQVITIPCLYSGYLDKIVIGMDKPKELANPHPVSTYF